MASMKEEEQRRIFDEWLAGHRSLLFKVVRAYAFTPADRDDLFQEVATEVWHSVPKFRGASSVPTWIYRVALYTAMAWSRRERRHRERHRPIEGAEPVLEEAAGAADPRLDWLYEQIARFDPVDRSLTLMMLDGHSYREIAGALGLTESHVGVKLNRIRRRLTEIHQQERP